MSESNSPAPPGRPAAAPDDAVARAETPVPRAEPPISRPGLLTLLAIVVLLAVAIQTLPVWPGLIQFVALPPLDLTADLRALLVYAPSVPMFVVVLAVLIAFRAAVLATLLGGLDRRRYFFAVRFYLLVLPFAALAAVPVYGGQAVLFYGAYWAGIVVTLGVLLLFGALPWHPSGRLRTNLLESAKKGFRVGTLGAYAAGLVLLGLFADAGGGVATVLAVPASAVLTWLTVHALYQDPGFRVTRRAIASVPAAGVVVLATLYFAGPDEAPEAAGIGETRDGSVMLMSGIDSRSGVGAILEIDPRLLGFDCEQTHYFSYAGPGDGQPREDAACEITRGAEYTAEDTMRARDELVSFLEEQTALMPAPATAVGHSQGVWLLWDAAVQDRLADVERVVLVGPYAANTVAYPPAGQRGPGRVGRLVLEPLANVARGTGHTAIDLDSPLGREWLGHPTAIQKTLSRRPADGIELLSVPSAFDLPLMPRGARIEHAVDACPIPVLHPDLPYASQLYEKVNRFLDGEEQPWCPPWRHAIGAVFRQFTAPPSPR